MSCSIPGILEVGRCRVTHICLQLCFFRCPESLGKTPDSDASRTLSKQHRTRWPGKPTHNMLSKMVADRRQTHKGYLSLAGYGIHPEMIKHIYETYIPNTVQDFSRVVTLCYSSYRCNEHDNHTRWQIKEHVGNMHCLGNHLTDE